MVSAQVDYFARQQYEKRNLLDLDCSGLPDQADPPLCSDFEIVGQVEVLEAEAVAQSHVVSALVSLHSTGRVIQFQTELERY